MFTEKRNDERMMMVIYIRRGNSTENRLLIEIDMVEAKKKFIFFLIMCQIHHE